MTNRLDWGTEVPLSIPEARKRILYTPKGNPLLHLDDTNEYVGIGTNSPQAALHIYSVAAVADILLSSASGATSWRISASNTAAGLLLVDENTGNSVAEIQNGAPAGTLVLASDGRVGMGPTGPSSPSRTVHMRDDETLTFCRLESTAVNSRVGFEVKNDTQLWQMLVQTTDVFQIGDGVGAIFSLEPGAGANAFYITSSGDVGIGTDSPAQKLDVQGSAYISGSIGGGISSPATNLHVQENNTDTTPAQEIEQLGAGDAAHQVTIPGRSYAFGVDATDSKWKLSTSATAGGAVLGTGTLFAISTTGVIDSLKSNNITNGAGTPYDNFPSGTKLVFYQASAPAGWTKDTSNSDAALRVVSGTGGGSGGTRALSSATTGTHTLVESEIPAHTHGPFFGDTNFVTQKSGSGTIDFAAGGLIYNLRSATGATGGGGSHDHPLALKYIDVIIASKN